MMKRYFSFLFTTVVILVSCQTGMSQATYDVDSIFNRNFVAFDSLAKGQKNQAQLTNEELAFFYILHSWVNHTPQYDLDNGIVLDQKELTMWKKWYSTNVKKIIIEDLSFAIQTYTFFFSTGIIDDEDIQKLDFLEYRYRQLSY